MVHGLDTGFLVAAEVAEHVDHSAARQTLACLVAAGDRIAIAPQILAELIHVVADPRRFTEPLSIEEARQLVQQWWTATLFFAPQGNLPQSHVAHEYVSAVTWNCHSSDTFSPDR